MKQFSIRTYKQGLVIEQPHFYILNKGYNSGKPAHSPWVNSFVLSCNSQEDADYYYWLLFAIWSSDGFYSIRRGSVIEFVTLDCLKQVIRQFASYYSLHPEELSKAVKQLNMIQQLEDVTKDKLHTIKQMKHAIAKAFTSFS